MMRWMTTVGSIAMVLDAVVAAVDVEGGFETSEIADTGHDSNADGFGRNRDVFGDSVDGEIAFDVEGVLAVRNDFGAAKGEGGIFFDVKEIVGAKNFVAAGARVSRLAAWTVTPILHFAGSLAL